MRSIGPVSIINEKTYIGQSAITRGYFVAKGNVDGSCTAVTAAGQKCLGLGTGQGNELTGDPVPVTRFGDGIAIAGAAFANDTNLTVDASGRVIAATGAGGEYLVGRAESTATALGDEVVVFVFPPVLG